MKLAHSELNNVIEFTEGYVDVWVIENPCQFYQYVMQLYMQINGAEGRFVLSHDMKELIISKKMDIILNPWQIDFSSRKILGRLYDEIKEVAWSSENYVKTKELMTYINRYVLDLEQHLDYDIVYPEEFDFAKFLKMLGIELDVKAESLLDQLVLYIKVCQRLLHINILVFVNIKDCLSDKELEELYKMAMYEKVQLLLIESSDHCDINLEKKYIIDYDLCEIIT